MRLPIFFSKKRGERRTGSPAWGSFGEGFFYASLLTAGLFVGGLMLTGVAVPEWRINNHFTEVEGRLVGKGLARRTTTDLFGIRRQSWRPAVLLEFHADGESVRAWHTSGWGEATTDRSLALRQLDGWRLGQSIRCWYDPERIETVVLKRGYSWWLWLLTLLLPGALVVFGATGLAQAASAWGRSEERQAAEIGQLLSPLVRSSSDEEGFPTVPACADLMNSPGTIQRFRLPTESPEAWSLLGAGLFALLWNAVVIVLAVAAGFDLAGGRTDWWLFGLLAPFGLIGLAAIGLFLRRLLLATAIGPTHLEISDHPLRPGGTYGVHLSQGGAVSFRRLELVLELEEQATFRQGTDVRTEKQVVWRELMCCWDRLEPVPGRPFEATLQFKVPARAMHSFRSLHNAVGWRLVLRGIPDRWPAFLRVFPLVIVPAGPDAAAAVVRQPLREVVS